MAFMISAASPIGAAGGGVEPVPARLGVGQAVLLGIEHEEAFALRDAVHARAGGEGIRILPAAVQHHQQRQPFAEFHTGRPVEPETPRSGRAHGHARQPGPGARQRRALHDDGPERLPEGPRARLHGLAAHRQQAAFEGTRPGGPAHALLHSVDHVSTPRPSHEILIQGFDGPAGSIIHRIGWINGALAHDASERRGEGTNCSHASCPVRCAAGVP